MVVRSYNTDADPSGSGVSQHLAQNIEAVCQVYARAEETMMPHQRIVDRLSALVGRSGFPYCALAFIAVWISVNLLAAKPFDSPPFYWLQGITGVSALMMSTVVLITQNRQSRLGDQRAHLELQINLLAEQKIAKLISLMEELRRDMPSVKNRYDAEAKAMAQPADARLVMDAIAEGFEDAAAQDGADDSGHLESVSRWGLKRDTEVK